MASLLGDAYVRVRPDTSTFGRDTNKSMTSVGKSAAKAFAVAFAAVGVGSLLKSTITEASDLGESINAVNVSYGNAAKGVKQLGRESARSLGMSNKEFNGLAVRFSSFSKTIAGEGGNVVGTLDDLTTRASDFASVMNLDVSKAAELFQSGLAGETEPLRAYGIDLSAAAVAAYAVANGISKSAKDMTEAEKVQARYGLLMKSTNNTAGDFANTSDSLANSQRILGASWDDLKAKAGTALLPALAGVTSFMADSVLPTIEGLGPKFATAFDSVKGPEIVASVRGWATDISADITSSPAWDFGTKILDRIKTGFSTGDWGPLAGIIKTAMEGLDAKTIGEGVGTMLKGALRNLGNIAGDVYTFLKDMIAKVDWASLAMEIGKQAPVVALGFVTGLLNFDIGAVFGFVADHWFEILIGAIGLFFAPARFIGKIAGILAKIPLVGPFLAKFLTVVKGLTDKVGGWVGGILGKFITGFRAGSPQVAGGFGRIISDIWTRIYVWGDDAVKWFKGIPGKLGDAIGNGAAAVGRGLGRLVDTLTGPLRTFLSWINTNFISKINKVTGLFGLTVPLIALPGGKAPAKKPSGKGGVQEFATGGVIPGYTPGRDTGLYALGGGEAILRPEATRALGENWVHSVNQAARLGTSASDLRSMALGGFASGGVVGAAKWVGKKAKATGDWAKEGIEGLIAQGAEKALKGIINPAADWVGANIKPEFLGKMGSGVLRKLAVSAAAWGKTKESEGLSGGAFSSGGKRTPGGRGGLGPAAASLRAAIVQAFGIRNIGGYANRNIAGTGKKSDHATGHAVDVMIANWQSAAGKAQGNKVASYMVNNASKFGMKYVIWDSKINSGSGWRPYKHPGGNSPTLQHKDHVHGSVYDNGGMLQPGLTQVYNKSGKPEAVLTNTEWEDFRTLVRNSGQGGSALVGGDLVIQSSGDARNDLEEALFQLRRKRRGGR